MKRALFFGIVLAIPALVLVAGAAYFLPILSAAARPGLLNYMAQNLTQAERKAIYEKLAQGSSFWDAVPDPDVAGLGQPNRTIVDAGAEVRFNNAGLRSKRDYSSEPHQSFRIVCLGDSFVFGQGGAEEDRFCEQLEAFYRAHDVTVGGRAIEAYAIGLPSWTLVQQTTYLATRITSYDPDLIIVLSVANDITDNFGVTGKGTLTYGFSPEYRSLGSSWFTDDLHRFFGDDGRQRAALSADLSPASRARWEKGMQRLKRLADLQRGRGKQILVSAMTWGKTTQPDDYAIRFHYHFARLGIGVPFVMTSFLPGLRTTLPHDSHPNRLGHQLLRDQYIHALHRLAWVSVPEATLPKLDRGTPVVLNPRLNADAYEDFRRGYASNLRDTIDFAQLRPSHTRAFVGGVLPEFQDRTQAVKAPPWGSLRTTFVLRRPQDRPLKGVEVEIEIPARPELFPFALKMLLDGVVAAELHVDRRNETGRYRIAGAPRLPAFYDPAVEVTLETSSYFSTIEDVRTKSYRLLRANIF